MRWSNYFIPTLKQAPADAEVISHKLLVRAGMVRKVTSGIYSFLPLGLRTLEKAKAIVREEMDAAGALELSFPMVQPGDLWRESGRWDYYGKELLRFQDRHDRDYCLGPTHEEMVTDLVRGEITSYRRLPLTLYQIQTKFRDEIRPRFGLMRGREFLMKDAYSFDVDDAGADASYRGMYAAYQRIFQRMGLRFRAVEADSGAIGGTFSHEFMVLADTGEDTIAVCTQCQYAANVERTEILWKGTACTESCAPCEEVATPGAHTIDDLVKLLGVPASRMIKTLLFDVDGEAVAVLVRGDREVNDAKVRNLLRASAAELATPGQVQAWTGAPVGFAGPVGLSLSHVYADNELQEGTDWIVGANKADTHLRHVDLGRDAHLCGYADLRCVTAEDVCPRCGGALELPQGIEVGHVFKLGTKYSQAMNANFLDENGRTLPMIMGCYGIGVSRVIAACIEQNHDANGIIFPPALSPFDLVLINLDPGNAAVNATTERLYTRLRAQGIDVLLDDREERPGSKFKDADLIGVPMQLVVGGKGLGRGVIEGKDRRSGEKVDLPVDGFADAFTRWRDQVLAGWAR